MRAVAIRKGAEISALLSSERKCYCTVSVRLTSLVDPWQLAMAFTLYVPFGVPKMVRGPPLPPPPPPPHDASVAASTATESTTISTAARLVREAASSPITGKKSQNANTARVFSFDRHESAAEKQRPAPMHP